MCELLARNSGSLWGENIRDYDQTPALIARAKIYLSHGLIVSRVRRVCTGEVNKEREPKDESFNVLCSRLDSCLAFTPFKLLRFIRKVGNTMAKTTKPGFYAGEYSFLITSLFLSDTAPALSIVQAGWQPGVYKTWDQCKAQVDGFKGCKHKKFPTLAEAEAFVQGRTPTESPSRPPASLSFHNEHNKSKSRARPNEQDDEPAAKRLKRPDPVFGTRESQFPAHRIVYSDGSSKGNGKRGAVAGSGVFWSHERGAKCV